MRAFHLLQILRTPSLRQTQTLILKPLVSMRFPTGRILHLKPRIIQRFNGVIQLSHFTTCGLICILGENQGDSSDGLWSIYLTEADKQDKGVTESWKGDTDGILVFVSLVQSAFARSTS